MTGHCRTAVLISGSGSNLQAFIDSVQSGALKLNLCVVFSNEPDAYGLERARQAGIPTLCLRHTDYADRESFDAAIVEELERFAPQLIVLAGFMRILSPAFVSRYRGRILNIHPALLPRYPGLNTHQRALDAGDAWHGSTVHFVTEELDAGPRILQGRIAVRDDDTAERLRERVQRVEHRIYPLAAGWVGAGKVRFDSGRCLLDDQVLDEPVVETY